MAKAMFLLRSTLPLPILCDNCYSSNVITLRKNKYASQNFSFKWKPNPTVWNPIFNANKAYICIRAVHKSNRIAKNKCKHKAFSSPLLNNIHLKRKLRLFCFFVHRMRSVVRAIIVHVSIMQNQINPMPSN